MSQLIDFFLRHWELSSLFLILLVLLIVTELRHVSSIKGLTSQQVVELFNHNQAVIFDIRPSTTYEQGHILGSLNLNVTELDQDRKKLSKYQNKNIILVNEDGRNLNKAAKQLQTLGIKGLMHLVGGIQAWKTAGLPLMKK